ncbi:MAG: hypothetical protein SGILL_002368 [Bacillariaceae sp.]
MKQIWDALLELVQKGKSHGDLKPGNIVLKRGDQDHLILVDIGKPQFRQAVQKGSSTKTLGNNAGSPAYQEPTSRQPNDRFASGVVMYELCTGSNKSLNSMTRLSGLTRIDEIQDDIEKTCSIPKPGPCLLATTIHRLLSGDQQLTEAQAFVLTVTLTIALESLRRNPDDWPAQSEAAFEVLKNVHRVKSKPSADEIKSKLTSLPCDLQALFGNGGDAENGGGQDGNNQVGNDQDEIDATLGEEAAGDQNPRDQAGDQTPLRANRAQNRPVVVQATDAGVLTGIMEEDDEGDDQLAAFGAGWDQDDDDLEHDQIPRLVVVFEPDPNDGNEGDVPPAVAVEEEEDARHGNEDDQLNDGDEGDAHRRQENVLADDPPAAAFDANRLDEDARLNNPPAEAAEAAVVAILAEDGIAGRAVEAVNGEMIEANLAFKVASYFAICIAFPYLWSGWLIETDIGDCILPCGMAAVAGCLYALFGRNPKALAVVWRDVATTFGVQIAFGEIFAVLFVLLCFPVIMFLVKEGWLPVHDLYHADLEFEAETSTCLLPIQGQHNADLEVKPETSTCLLPVHDLYNEDLDFEAETTGLLFVHDLYNEDLDFEVEVEVEAESQFLG